MSEIIIKTEESIRQFKDVVKFHYSNKWNSVTITQEINNTEVVPIVDDVRLLISQV